MTTGWKPRPDSLEESGARKGGYAHPTRSPLRILPV